MTGTVRDLKPRRPSSGREHARNPSRGSRRSSGSGAFGRFNLRPTPGKFIAAGLAVAALFLAIQIITVTLSDASLDPEAALSWRPGSSSALAWGADDILASAEGEVDLQAAEELATRALLVSPLEVSALRTLGLVADQRGAEDRAGILLSQVARRAPRDRRAHAWMFQRKIRAGDYDGGLSHIDAVLRTRPSLFPDLAPVLISFATDPAAFQTLATYLETNPPWRGSLLNMLPAEAENTAGLFPLYASLEEGPTPPVASELSPLLNRLIRDGEIDRAYLFWLQFIPEERVSDASALYNGHFGYPISGLPFDWQIRQVRGAQTDVADTGEGGQQALRIRFFGTRVPFQHVSQLMALAPGDYQLRGQTRPTGLETPRGMQWVVRCGSQELGASERISGSLPWQDFSFAFTVPPDPDCRAQTVQLRIAARVASEQQVAGEIWFDNLSVERISP